MRGGEGGKRGEKGAAQLTPNQSSRVRLKAGQRGRGQEMKNLSVKMQAASHVKNKSEPMSRPASSVRKKERKREKRVTGIHSPRPPGAMSPSVPVRSTTVTKGPSNAAGGGSPAAHTSIHNIYIYIYISIYIHTYIPYLSVDSRLSSYVQRLRRT
jgi:hypothetical protein